MVDTNQSTANVPGIPRDTRVELEMAVFDNLQPACRAALNDAPFNCSALDMRRLVHRHGTSYALDAFAAFLETGQMHQS
jgi:hypothetical protein